MMHLAHPVLVVLATVYLVIGAFFARDMASCVCSPDDDRLYTVACTMVAALLWLPAFLSLVAAWLWCLVNLVDVDE